MTLKEISKFKIEILAHEHLDMLCAFSCDESGFKDGLEDYIHNHTIGQLSENISYIVYDPEINKMIGIFSLCCSAAMVRSIDENGKESTSLIPAVEIKIFALDLAYQHIQIEDFEERATLGDALLSVCTDMIMQKIPQSFGASMIILYANSEKSRRFYKRNGFLDFDTDMFPNQDPFVEDCYPMYLLLSFDD